MKAFVLTGWLFLLLILPAASADDEATLRHFKTVLWQQAYRMQDTDLLERLLHDDFAVIDDAGNVSTKQQELVWISENKWDPGEFEYRIERLDIYDGRFAIIAGTGIAEAYIYKSSNVLIKDSGQWRAVSSHVSGVEEMPLAEADRADDQQ